MNPLYILFTLQLGDLISTVLALRSGNGREANGLLAPLFDKFGALPTLLIVKGAVIAALWFNQSILPQEILWVLCAGYAYVVVNNFKIVFK